MPFVSFNGASNIVFGYPGRPGVISIPALTTTIQMDAVNEAVIMYGQVYNEDGGSHTIDTTGASSLNWYAASNTFVNAGTTVKVGLAEVDGANGPPARAVNVSNVISFDVSKTIIGGSGGIPESTWQNHVPDAGTKTIANGDTVAFCIQMTARGGSDIVRIGGAAFSSTPLFPGFTSYLGGTYSAASTSPSCAIKYSDGTMGFLYLTSIFSGSTQINFNNTSGTKEIGNRLVLPFPAKICGVVSAMELPANSGVDLILYSDPFGTPVAEKTVTVNQQQISTGASGFSSFFLFPSPFTLKPNVDYVVAVKPTTSTNIEVSTVDYVEVENKASMNLSEVYAVGRDTGSFSVLGTESVVAPIGVLIGAFDYGVQPTYVLGV